MAALGDFAFVQIQGERHVGEHRQRGLQGLVEQNLAGGVGHVVLAADDMGDTIADVINHIAEQIEWLAVGANDDEILDLTVGPLDPAQDLVVVEEAARSSGDLEADGGRKALGFLFPHLLGGQVSAGAVIADLGFFFGQGNLPLPLQLLFGAEAFVGMARGQEAVGGGDMVDGKVGLEVRALVPIDPQPGEPVDDAVDGGLA